MILFAVSCGQKNSTSPAASVTSENPVASATASVSILPSASSASSKPLSKTKQIDAFSKALQAKAGQVNQVRSTSVRTSQYLTDGSPLTMVEKDVATQIRYQDKTVGDLLDQNGKYSLQNSEGVFGTPSDYEIQTFHDATYFYRLTHYADGSETDTKKTINYQVKNEDAIFNLSLATEEIPLLATLKDRLDTKDNEVTFDFPQTLPDEGTVNYTYGIKVMEEDSELIKQQVTYVKKITLKQGLVTHLEETLNNDFYAAGVKANWFSTVLTKDYQQGDFATFEGKVFDPTLFQA
jgi:hypothetical protein